MRPAPNQGNCERLVAGSMVEGVDEVECGTQHDGTFVEGFADEVNLAGGEVADSSVDKLDGAGGGGLGEVEGCFVASGGGVYDEA